VDDNVMSLGTSQAVNVDRLAIRSFLIYGAENLCKSSDCKNSRRMPDFGAINLANHSKNHQKINKPMCLSDVSLSQVSLSP